MSAYRQNAEQSEPTQPPLATKMADNYHAPLDADELAFWEQTAAAVMGGLGAADARELPQNPQTKKVDLGKTADIAASWADALLAERNKRKNGGFY